MSFVSTLSRSLSTPTTWVSRRFLSSQAISRGSDVFIVGAGCIGQSLAVSLLKSNSANRVFLQTKSQYIGAMNQSGVTTKGAVDGTFVPDNKFRLVDVIDEKLFEQSGIHRSPIIFSATKASQAASSLVGFNAIRGIQPTIICLQNGLGSEQEIQKSLPNHRSSVLKGHVLGAVHQKDSHLFAYKGKILIERGNAAISEILRELFRHQDQAIFSLEISGNIYKDIYPKIAVNCVCNPLTIILNQNLGFIKEHYEPLIEMICHEVYRVAIAQGIPLISSKHLGEFVLDMMSRFSSHHSSMYLDHIAGRETEIDYINGGILQIAKKHGIEAPVNELLTKAVKDIQKKRATAKSAEEFYQVHGQYLKDLTNQLIGFLHTPRFC